MMKRNENKLLLINVQKLRVHVALAFAFCVEAKFVIASIGGDGCKQKSLVSNLEILQNKR